MEVNTSSRTDLLVEQDGVLVVVAFPGHKADQRVLAERDLAVAGGRAVGHDIADFNAVAAVDDRSLVDAGALVGTQEFVRLSSDPSPSSSHLTKVAR
jgi:hypothetical protein